MNTRLFITGLLVAAATASQAQVWDLKDDFSLTNNPNGAWNYGSYDIGGNFTANSTVGSVYGFDTSWMGDDGGRPVVGMNTSGSLASGVADGQVFLHPDYTTGAAPYAGVHWVSPIDGHIFVTGTFYAGDSASVSEFTSIDRSYFFTTAGDQFDDYTFAFDVDIEAGHFLDFFIGPNSSGDPSFGSTPLDIHITSASTVPEPASLAVLGLGVLGFIRRKRA